MYSHFRIVLGLVIGISFLMLVLYLGGPNLHAVRIFSPLTGALIGSALVLITVLIPFRQKEDAEPWLGREKLAWILIGCGCVGWSIGECFWRYYVARGQNPFPSLADGGYTTFSPLVFCGLILQPFSGNKAHKRVFLLLDCLIAMGALLSIAWFLLLGPLAQSPAESVLSKVLAIYYPTTDVALLSCVTFLLLRGHNHTNLVAARRISLIVAGIGLSIYAASDFFFNWSQNLGIYMDGTWTDLGWPLGMMTLGIAAYLRRFLPGSATQNTTEKQEKGNVEQFTFGLPQLVPYLLLSVLFLVLALNVFSSDTVQRSIRPVLVIATFIVIGLVIIRQILTMLENRRLVQMQETTLEKLEQVYQDVAKRNADLETGVTHLKEVQTRLANGDVRARAQIRNDDLWPLATGLNLMADRMMRSEQNQRYAQKTMKAISDLSMALEKRRHNTPFVLPASCLESLPELHRLLQLMGLKADAANSTSIPNTPHSVNPATPRPSMPATPRPSIPATPQPTPSSQQQRPTPSLKPWRPTPPRNR